MRRYGSQLREFRHNWENEEGALSMYNKIFPAVEEIFSDVPLEEEAQSAAVLYGADADGNPNSNDFEESVIKDAKVNYICQQIRSFFNVECTAAHLMTTRSDADKVLYICRWSEECRIDRDEKLDRRRKALLSFIDVDDNFAQDQFEKWLLKHWKGFPAEGSISTCFSDIFDVVKSFRLSFSPRCSSIEELDCLREMLHIYKCYKRRHV